MVIYLERVADLHMSQLMPLQLTVSCSSKIQTGFTFLVPAHPGSSGKRAIKCVCVCVLLSSRHVRTQFKLSPSGCLIYTHTLITQDSTTTHRNSQSKLCILNQWKKAMTYTMSPWLVQEPSGCGKQSTLAGDASPSASVHRRTIITKVSQSRCATSALEAYQYRIGIGIG